MAGRFTSPRVISQIFWVLTIAAVLIWSQVPSYVVGWDLRVYENAMHSLQAGHDPYSDGIAVQRAYHAETVHAPGSVAPFTYVYSPLTLPLVRVVGHLPTAISASLYWILFALCVFAAIWVGLQLVEEKEKPVIALLAPSAVFFPGLLQNDVLFSGNIAYIFYGLVLIAAVVGWRQGKWRWFYLAVLAASCFKAPLLSLLAIPVFSARRQWLPAGVTGALGLSLFAIQPLLWPVLFRHYLEAVELQFSFNHDFSSSPAGLLADALYDVIPYGITSTVFYIFYAILFASILFYFSRRFLAGRFSIKQWAPVLLIGVILLNPRIMEYDVAPITLLMATVAWRFLIRGNTVARASFLGMVIFFALNRAAPRAWRPTECIILVGLFFAGLWDLYTLEDHASVKDEGLSDDNATVNLAAV